MHRSLLLTVTMFSIVASLQAQLIITAVYDGPLRGGNPKGVELYATESIPDLSIYGVGFANNGGGTDSIEFTFPTVAANAGQFIYVSKSPSTNEEDTFKDYFGFDTDYTDFQASINGDDAIELFKNNVVIDVFGDIDTDGTGEDWDYLDSWAYRKSTTGPDGSTFVLDNFTYGGPGALNNCTTNATCSSVIPVGTYSLAPLPVNLIELTAAPQPMGARVAWITGSQLNNDYFDVEVSTDGLTFERAGRVNGHGTTDGRRDYSFEYKAQKGGVHYFRLHQVDFDGTSSTSHVVVANLRTTGTSLALLSNVVGETLILDLDKPSELQVVSLTGAVVAQRAARDAGRVELDLSQLPAGLYLVSDGQVTRRFVKQ